jgi:hypothetical protein
VDYLSKLILTIRCDPSHTEKTFDVNRDRAPFAATVELIDRATGRTTMIPTEWMFVG